MLYIYNDYFCHDHHCPLQVQTKPCCRNTALGVLVQYLIFPTRKFSPPSLSLYLLLFFCELHVFWWSAGKLIILSLVLARHIFSNILNVRLNSVLNELIFGNNNCILYLKQNILIILPNFVVQLSLTWSTVSQLGGWGEGGEENMYN